jgi:hypothetical protein
MDREVGVAEGIAVAPVRRARGATAAKADRQAGSQSGPATPARRQPAPALGRRSFRLPEVVLGVFLVAGCALGALLWQQHADRTTTVVVAARSIVRGSVITAADMRAAKIGGETEAMIPASSARSLLGTVAVVDIGADVPFTATIVTHAAPLGADEALTSVALAPGLLPPDLAPGDDVRIVVTRAADASGASSTDLLPEPAVVWSVDAAPDGASTVVTIRGPLSLATEVAAAVRVRLARVAGS